MPKISSVLVGSGLVFCFVGPSDLPVLGAVPALTMMVGRAGSVHRSGSDEYVRCVAAAPDERSGEGCEILALRHQIRVLQRQLGGERVRFERADRALVAALLSTLPGTTLRRLQLVMSPDTGLRWHRDLPNRRHAARSRPKRPGRPRTMASIRRLVLRLAHENGTWGHRELGI